MRNTRQLVQLTMLVCLAAAACGTNDNPPASGNTAAERRLESLAGTHPRLFLSPATVEQLRPALGTTHRWLWERFQQDLPRMVKISRREIPLEDVRYDGDLAAELAFAWLMTQEDSLLEIARQQVLRLTDPASWKAPGSLVYLIGSHFLMGISLAYDWLYPVLTDQERSQIAECLSREAQAQYESIVHGRIWWRNQYFQNHSHSNYCGLAFAAAALFGEDERAVQWLSVCEEFFDKIFQIMPQDGSSVEGYAYAGYGGEYILKYAMLARDHLGRDYTGSPWMKNYASYMLHGLLPVGTAGKWAMTFGDGPHRGWTSTAQHLFLLASLYHDSTAQWMGEYTLGLQQKGLGSQGWMMLLFYNPRIGRARPAIFPTFKFFPEVGQVMARSAWEDTSATLVGFKCGPFMGLSHSAGALFDWGSGHAEPDAGSFQLFAHGQFLSLNALYTGYQRSANHNTMLFKGAGQLGEEIASFASIEALRFGHYPQLVRAISSPRYDYMVGDVTRAYHPALGLKKYIRHLVFLKPDILIVADEIDLEDRGALYNFPSQHIQAGPGLSHNSSGQVTGQRGEARIVFNGRPGIYRIYACYLDNIPETAAYEIEVDGRTIHRWQSHNQDRDDNLIEVTPEVKLEKGSQIIFRGKDMPETFRLTKMAACGTNVPFPRSAQWLLHCDPEAVVSGAGGRWTASLGGAALDVYPLAPAGTGANWEKYEILRADVEPFNYPWTNRLVLNPRFSTSDLTMLTLLHARRVTEPGLEKVVAELRDGRVRVSWERRNEAFNLNWDLKLAELILRQSR